MSLSDSELLDAINEAKAAGDMPLFHKLMFRAYELGLDKGLAEEVSFDPRQRYHFAWYSAMRAAGTPHRLAEMLALSQAPFIMTDAVFLEGMHKIMEKDPEGHDYYKSVADAQGVSVTGAIYHPGLAEYAGDPRAWIRGRGDIQRIAEERNLRLTGDGNVAREFRNDVAPPPDVPVAHDVVQQRIFDMVEANPDLAHGDRMELYEQAKDSLLPRPAPVKDDYACPAPWEIP